MSSAQQATPPPSADRYKALSALIAASAAAEVLRQLSKGPRAMYAALFRRQMMAVILAEKAVVQVLADQGYDGASQAALVPQAFVTPADAFAAMVDSIDTTDVEARTERLAESLTQEAARVAQQVAVAVRPEVRWVRHLTLPSCSRCAVLAGRIYRYSQGFRRHPGCDCTMLPITVASPDLTVDPVELARKGDVAGLSKADRRALDEGADFAQVVNVRAKAAGLSDSGQVLVRAGRLTPAGIFDQAGDDREYAVELLRKYGYIR